MARDRLYASNADRQKAYRNRAGLLQCETDAVMDALLRSLDRGSSLKHFARLDESSKAAYLNDVVTRLDSCKLVAFAVKVDGSD